MPYVALVALALAVVAFAVPYFCRRRTMSLKIVSVNMDRAYEAARQLINDDAVPEAVGHLAFYLAYQSSRPHLAISLCWDLLRGRLPLEKQDDSEMVRAVRALDKDRAQILNDLFIATLLGSAAASYVLAGQMRRFILWTFNGETPPVEETKTRLPALATEMEPAVARCTTWGANDLVAA